MKQYSVFHMVELVRGLKAGILGGLVYGVFYAFFVYFFFYAFGALFGVPTKPPPFGGEYVKLSVNPFVSLIIGPILGIILGLIYAAAYNRLPGKKLGNWSVSMTKGAFLTFIVWVILFLISAPTNLPTSLLFHELGAYRAFQITLILFAMWFFVIFGEMIGYFWDRFRRRQPKTA